MVAVAGLYAVGALLWLALGDTLPGGRWFAVHLFTLGILTNLIVALTHHFGQTLLHTPGGGPRTARFVLLNVGVLLMLGLPPGLRWPLALGATLGVLMGVGVLGGAWYGAARIAHLHINILGWGGRRCSPPSCSSAPRSCARRWSPARTGPPRWRCGMGWLR